MYLHLACFLFMYIGHNFVPATLTTNNYIWKTFFFFVTVPLYIYMIMDIEQAIEQDRFKFDPKSTSKDLRIIG